jgi:NADH dehydrogenase/NADH:ubiquinone oxidoreductase subunit G
MNLVKAAGRTSDSGRWRLMEVAMGANTAGSRFLGDGSLDLTAFDPHTAELAFVVLGDDDRGWPREWIEKLRTVSYVVAMAAREHDILDSANVVIPTATWAERAGTYVNLEGRVQKGIALMDRPGGCVDELEFFEKLAKAWRGPGCDWVAPGIPDMLRPLADGHIVPCETHSRRLDFSGLENLVAE